MNQLNILLIDNKSKSTDKLTEQLSLYGKVTVIDFNKLTSFDLTNTNLIVLSGSSLLNINYNINDVREEIDLVMNTKIPIIGVCFGFELICLAYDSTVVDLKEHVDEFRSIKLDRSFFKNMPDSISVKEAHSWGVKEVGDSLQVLGTSKDSVEIVKHKNKKTYGFQFHPELYLNITQGDDLLNYVIEDIFK